MNETLYSNRKVNMMRVNELRKAGSIAKILFLESLAGAYVFDFEGNEAMKYPQYFYCFKKIIENTPSFALLHGNINSYRGAQILKLMQTSVDNKKLKSLLRHKDSSSNKSASEVLDIVKSDLKNYQLLLDTFTAYRHSKAMRILRNKMRRQLDIPAGGKLPYNISMKIPYSLKPLITEYKRLNKGK